MAYRRASRRPAARRSAPARRSPVRRAASYRRAPARGVRSRAAPRQQTVRLVIEQAPAGIARPLLPINQVAAPAPRKAVL